MKKNISINISGIIFHIEEDGYENLRKYLDSINKYFSSFEDSSEILADIESRIAELFLSKLNEGKQVITMEDVTALIATMGSVSDFKAAEEQESAESQQQSSKAKEEYSSGKSSSYNYEPQKPFQRDQKRKILGGVCAGIGNYFNIDPVWVRLLTALLAFAYGIGFLIYLVLWIAIPGSYELEEAETGKKMFRDTERKVLGGVSGGLAAFFGVDVVLVRLIFVLTTCFFGTGILVYLVLWVVLPEARSLTDRMQMQGEPVTLSNIESNIKKNLNEDPDKEESALMKIILFPFRLIGMMLSVLGKILIPIAEIIRVAIGVFIVLFGVGLLFTTIIGGGVLLGIFTTSTGSWPWMDQNAVGMPLQIFVNSIPTWLVVAAFGAALIPVIFIMLFGTSIIAKRFSFNATTGWTLFVLFFVSVAMLGVGLPKIILAFKEDGEFKIENTYPLPEKRAVFKINEVGMDDYDGVSLTLRGYSGKELKLVQAFGSQGVTRQNAIENAQLVTYFVDVQDSIITFDSNLKFKEDAIFRNQRLELMLYIPYDYPFVMDKSFASSYYFISHHIDYDNRDGFVWTMKEDDGLTCLNCPRKDEEDESGIHDQFGLSDFDKLDLSGFMNVNITSGEEYAVEMLGSDSEKRKYKIYKSGKTLVVDFEGQKKFDWDGKFVDIDEVRINITMPHLEKIEGGGYGTITFDEFTSDDMEIEIKGPIKVNGSLNAHNLIVHLTGKSEAELSGQVNNLDANLQFASKLKAYNLEVTEAVVEVSGISTAKVNVQNTLEIDSDVTSDIDYHGSPQIVKKD